ncbi:MAG: hypothetical protein D6729_04510, partial [Deltaproteobacteria bacterium]
MRSQARLACTPGLLLVAAAGLLAGCSRDFALPGSGNTLRIANLELTPPCAGLASEVFIDFDLSGLPAAPPVVDVAGRPARLEAESGGHYRFVYRPTASDPEGD